MSGRDPGSGGYQDLLDQRHLICLVPTPRHPWGRLLRALSLSPADGLLTSARVVKPIARDEEKTHGIFAFTIRKSGFKSIEFSTGHLKTRYCFHHHTPPIESIYPQLMLQSQGCAAEFEINKPSHQSNDHIHQVKYPFSGGAAPSCYCWPKSLYQSPAILAAILAMISPPKANRPPRNPTCHRHHLGTRHTRWQPLVQSREPLGARDNNDTTFSRNQVDTTGSKRNGWWLKELSGEFTLCLLHPRLLFWVVFKGSSDVWMTVWSGWDWSTSISVFRIMWWHELTMSAGQKKHMKHAVEFEAAIQRWQRWKSICKEFQENKKKHRQRK